jgi:signal transduction histidine kinase
VPRAIHRDQLPDRPLSDDHVVAERLLAERAERRRIAEQLHDGPVQHVAALSQMLDALTQALDAEDLPGARPIAARALAVARDAADELRGIVAGLEPITLDEVGLGAAVREVAERTVGRRGATVDVGIDEDGLGEGARSSIFQVIREALDQAARRGPPTAVAVSLARTPTGGVELTVSDDGAPERRQAVLDGLAERAAELNGTFEATRQGEVTTIRLTLPPSAARL